jgi:hypothetical protein
MQVAIMVYLRIRFMAQAAHGDIGSIAQLRLCRCGCPANDPISVRQEQPSTGWSTNKGVGVAKLF